MRSLLILLLAAASAGAANFTYVSGAVAADGLSVTLNLTAPVACAGLTPTTGVPGISVYDSVANIVYTTTLTATTNITAACTAATAVTLVLTLQAPIRSGLTIKGSFNFSGSSTLTDTAGDTIATNAAAAITNNSTVTGTAYTFSNAGIKFEGAWTDNGDIVFPQATGSGIETAFTGTKFCFNTYAGFTQWTYSTDGAASANLSVASVNSYNTNPWVMICAAAVADASHSFRLVSTSNGYLNQTQPTFMVVGASPAVAVPTGYGQNEYAVNQTTWAVSPTLNGYPKSNGVLGFGFYDHSDGYGAAGTASSGADGALLFATSAGVTDVWVWLVRNGQSSIAAYVDGTLTATTAIPSGANSVGTGYDFVHVLTGLSGAHTILLNAVYSYPQQMNGVELISVMVAGGTISSAGKTIRKSVTWIGDSIPGCIYGSSTATCHPVMAALSTYNPSSGLPVYPFERRQSLSGQTCAQIQTADAKAYIDANTIAVIMECGINDARGGGSGVTMQAAIVSMLGDFNTALIAAGVVSSVPIIAQNIFDCTNSISIGTLNTYRGYYSSAVATYNATVPTHPATLIDTTGWLGDFNTYTITGATWAAGVATYAISGGTTAGILPQYPVVTTVSITPSGYNQPNCVATVVDTTHFSCALVSDPGMYGSGGAAGWNTPDGIHPNDSGYAKIAAHYVPIMQRFLFGCVSLVGLTANCNGIN